MKKYIEECECCTVEDDIKQELCTVCLTQRILRGKWKLVIISLLKKSPRRFNELKRCIPKVTQGYLSSQLKELIEDDIVIRKSYNEVPPRVEYYLSDEGNELINVVDSMSIWGKDYVTKRMKL